MHGGPSPDDGTAGAGVSPEIRRAQDGDLDAFDRVYRENVGRVYAVCLRMTGDPGKAEELTQSVFVRAWTKLGQFRGESRFSTWLHRLAVNVVIQTLRSERRRGHRFLPLDADATERVGRAESPDVRLDLDRAIAALPPGARAVLVLYDVEGYPHEEIGRMLGIAVGTAKAQLHRARRLLREALG
ncbi:MAG: sigma-70 family RNA polymerase sigma factor [Gammaproteobacteria bacterium]|nr:sigma-70 family RNA polymerase sigma factor [Gammaproteobacteria bacterium]